MRLRTKQKSPEAAAPRTPFPRPPQATGAAPEQRWWEKFAQLEALWLAGGDANVLTHFPVLGPWLSNQRTQWRKGTLAAERIEALQHIGVWLEMPQAERGRKRPHAHPQQARS